MTSGAMNTLRKMLTLKEVADSLGFHPRTVEKWADSGKWDFPMYEMIGAQKRFYEDEVAAWARSPNKPKPEPSASPPPRRVR